VQMDGRWTHTDTQNAFIICPIAICYSCGAYNNWITWQTATNWVNAAI